MISEGKHTDGKHNAKMKLSMTLQWLSDQCKEIVSSNYNEHIKLVQIGEMLINWFSFVLVTSSLDVLKNYKEIVKEKL